MLLRSRCWRFSLVGFPNPQDPPLSHGSFVYLAWLGDSIKMVAFVVYNNRRSFPFRLLRLWSPQAESCTLDQYVADPLVGAISRGEMPSLKIKHTRKYRIKRKTREARSSNFDPSKHVDAICIYNPHTEEFSPLISAYGLVPTADGPPQISENK